MYSQEGPDVFGFIGRLLLICAIAWAVLAIWPMLAKALELDRPAITVSLYEAVQAQEQAEIAAEGLAEGYTGIPLTQHAQDSHAGELWNAASIAEAFDAGKCVPQQYSCDANDYVVHYCEINPGKSIALVIGKTIRTIITGFMADTSYWTNRCGALP